MENDEETYGIVLDDPWTKRSSIRLDVVRLQCGIASVGGNYSVAGRRFSNLNDYLAAFRDWDIFLSQTTDYDLAERIVQLSSTGDGPGVAVHDYWDYMTGPARTVTALGAFSLLNCPPGIGGWRRELRAMTAMYRRSGRRSVLSRLIRLSYRTDL